MVSAVTRILAIQLPTVRRIRSGRDRKSTRLNSSHSSISYAVFCLKKKKEIRRKAEQKSTKMHGEVQELAMDEMLRAAFPFDEISAECKGVRGANCIQTVRHSFGQE